MFNGVDIIFFIPPLLLLIVATVVGLWQYSKHGAKRALLASFIVLALGGLLIFALLVVWLYIYYSSGGH
ncbi:MAG TPA: hypothetical protein VGB76_09685 [Pyrinomonadaceae bacterium]|jgi:cytochrome c oxidase assembly factor CtaG